MARFAANSSRLKQAALGGAAIWLAMMPADAWAACAVTSGSGTVGSPTANSTITCTNATAGLVVSSSADNVTVVVDPNAAVLGNPGDAITLTGNAGAVVVNGVVLDLTVEIGSPSATGVTQLSMNNGAIENLNPANTLSVRGNNARIILASGSQILTASSLNIAGPNALFEVDSSSGIVAAPTLAGPLIQGGAQDEQFRLFGLLQGRDVGGIVAYLDAGDGNDRVVMSGSTRLWEISTTAAPPASVSLRGGDGFDTLELWGGSGDGSIEFSTSDFEALLATANAQFQLGGSHAFQSIRINAGSSVETTDFTSLGLATSSIELDRLNPNVGRLVIRDPGTHQFQHSLLGPGEIEFAAGDYTFQTASPSFNGSVLVNDATLRIENSQAFGSGTITNNANVVLRDVTLNNTLFGNGTYIVDGTSSRITGFGNQMSGFVEIRAGELIVEDLRALGNQNTPLLANLALGMNTQFVLDLPSNGQLDLGDPRQVLGNPLSGSGTFVKRGQGSVIIDGSNPVFIGQIRLEGGWLHIADQDGLGQAANGQNAITFAGGALSLGDMTLANQLTGQGVIDKSTAGRTVMTGDNSSANLTWTLNAGTLAGTQSRNFGATGTNISIGSNATFELTNASDHNLDLRISGLSGSTFRKLGAGQLNFIDLFNVSNLLVDAGSIRVNQTITANTTLASGTRLDGTGRIIGNLANNGTVAPGNSIGTLTVQGNYVHGANATLEIEFDGAGGIDLLDVTGNVTLNGGTLRFVSLGGAEGSGGTFLKAGGTLSGTFATVQTVGSQLPLAVIYQTSSALMAPSVLTARPSTFNAQFLAAADTGAGFAALNDAAMRRLPRGTQLWLDSFGSDGRRSASSQTLAYGHDTYGLAGGVTIQLGETTSIGLSAGWTSGDIALGSNGGGGEQSSVLGALTLRHDFGDTRLTGGALFGKIEQETLRNVSFNGFAATVNGTTESTIYGGFLGLDLPIANLGKWTLGGNLRGTWLHQDQDGYTESGTSPLRLTLGDLSAETLEGQAGLSIGRHFGPQGGGADFRVEAGGRVLGLGGDRLIPVSFAANNAAVTLQGDTRDSFHGYAAASLDISLSEAARIHIGYSGQIGATDRHLGRIGLSFGF